MTYRTRQERDKNKTPPRCAEVGRADTSGVQNSVTLMTSLEDSGFRMAIKKNGLRERSETTQFETLRRLYQLSFHRFIMDLYQNAWNDEHLTPLKGKTVRIILHIPSRTSRKTTVVLLNVKANCTVATLT
jgi:hypothetical protein